MDYTKYCSLTYDGKLLDHLIDGYMTINVEGRGLLGRVISSVDVPGRDGVVILSQKLSARTITVHYLLKADNSKFFLERLMKLHDLLKADNDVIFKFGDEEYFRHGRLTDAKDPPHDYFQGVGSFTLLCQDPYKYKNIESLVGLDITAPGTSLYPYKIQSISVTFPADRTGLEIHNVTTGRKIILTGEFNAGQVLQILPSDGKILLNNQNIMNRLDFEATDWKEFEIFSGNQILAAVSMTINLVERSL